MLMARGRECGGSAALEVGVVSDWEVVVVCVCVLDCYFLCLPVFLDLLAIALRRPLSLSLISLFLLVFPDCLLFPRLLLPSLIPFLILPCHPSFSSGVLFPFHIAFDIPHSCMHLASYVYCTRTVHSLSSYIQYLRASLMIYRFSNRAFSRVPPILSFPCDQEETNRTQRFSCNTWPPTRHGHEAVIPPSSDHHHRQQHHNCSTVPASRLSLLLLFNRQAMSPTRA